MLRSNTGAYSSVYYNGAPNNYKVKNGYYTLKCVYGTTQRASLTGDHSILER
jgi:hypothetical protein